MKPGLHLKCLDCGHVFPADQAAHREAELGECMRLGDLVDICPNCFSDELQELQRCEICGGPVRDEDSDFCMGCQFIIDSAFTDAIIKVRDRIDYDGNNYKLIGLMFDRAEEKNLYRNERSKEWRSQS